MAREFITNDGVKIVYEKLGNGNHDNCVVLLHGWSGSKHYFDLNSAQITKSCSVYILDQRFHGESGKPEWGFHVARLAKDLHEFLLLENLQNVTLVGTSMGASVIWCYFELFAGERIGKAVFVDQAPLQNIADDWKLGSKGCYDAASLAKLQFSLEKDFEDFAKGTSDACLTQEIRPEVLAALEKETLKCNPKQLGKLMADHTQLDWRPVLPLINVPCLNCVGRKSDIFPWEGVAVVGDMIPNCCTVFFEDCNHWLYIEEPKKFSELISDFAIQGNEHREKVSSL
eukprot:TRINITY_DN23067_c1_g1_i5.p1 TRINITY_DN23067_c1_g1~~TRINITY_DN23067_c1_g1_i5.p1  ORF type:complete len:298 (+),score=38.22 TRINITY_DN23067_c1_g1_i5:40-894(+)